jgi:hypothetical protein
VHVEPQRTVEKLIRDQQPVGADNDSVGGELHRPVEPRRLRYRDVESLRHLLRGRRPDAASPAGGRVRPRQEADDVVLRREPLEHVCAERRGRRDRNPPVGHHSA